jgi:hypothetical protein
VRDTTRSDRRGAGRWTLSVALVVAATGALSVPVPSAGASTAVSNVTVAVTPPSSAANALTTYNIGFKTSASGALSGSAGDTITIVLPTGTGLSNLTSSPVKVGATQVAACYLSTGTTVSCGIYNGATVAASTTVAVALNGVNNPATTGTKTLKVSTTSDATAVTSPSYTITAAKSLTNVTVAVSPPSSAVNALTTYNIGFTTSTTGGLSGTAGSSITIVLPAGTGLSNLTSSPVKVGATQVASCYLDTGTTVTCDIYYASNIAPSTAVTVALNGVNNPATTGAKTLQVSTTSDTPLVTSPTYTITAVKSLVSASIAVSSNLPSATGVTYSMTLKASATGALSGTAGSSITIVLPAGTGLTNLTSSPVMVGATQVASCYLSTGTTVGCDIYYASTVAASATIGVTLNGVKNPATPSTYTLKVSTTSDTKVKTTPRYCIVAAGVPCISSVAPAKGGVGAPVTITGVNLAGATAVKFNGTAASIGTNTATKITTTVPAGATTGTVTVTTGGGTATSPTSFTVIPTPTISGFSPQSGTVGTTVTISGSNLANATNVAFNGVAAAILTDSAGQVTANVPGGATTGKITVTTAGGTATSATDFTVT